MNSLRVQYAHLFDLLAQHSERRLNAAQSTELCELLVADPVARGIYRQYQTVVTGLSWECTDPSQQAAAVGTVASSRIEVESRGRTGAPLRPTLQPIVAAFRSAIASFG